jgi:dTDP-4-dehydrorhamnose reductase
MKILIIGANGQLGKDMVTACKAANHDTVGVDLPQIDITDGNQTSRFISSVKPDTIINCAAFTAVDRCESDRAKAFAANRDGVAHLAEAAATCGAALAHISTDYVFDGTKREPYVETDLPNPRSVYGESKLAGEQVLAKILPRHYIFRIAWLYGLQGANFVKTIRTIALQKAHNGESLRVVDDQVGTPTYTREVCAQILAVLSQNTFGLFHCTAEGACSWYAFARHIIESYRIAVDLQPCTTVEFPRPAPRPANSVLENARLKKEGLNRMVEWRQAFAAFLEEERQPSGE